MKHAYRPRLGRAGFSALELMTVLVILTIAGSLATPSLRGFVDQSRTRRALDQLVADLSYARLLAVEEGRRFGVRLQSDGSYTIESLSTGGSWTPVHNVRLRDEFDGVSLEGDVSMIEFSSRGLMTSLTGDSYVRLTVNGSRDSIFLSPAGRVYRDF